MGDTPSGRTGDVPADPFEKSHGTPAGAGGNPVRRCVCFDTAFEDILAELRCGGTLMSAHQQTGFGARCGLCVPYVLRAAQTGDSSQPVMWTKDFESHGIPPGAVAQFESRDRGRAAFIDQ